LVEISEKGNLVRARFCVILLNPIFKVMEVPFIDLRGQYRSIKVEIDEAVEAVFEGGQFVGGKFVHQWETSFASLLNINHCIGVGNGTDAIFIALKSLGVLPGDEVITPAFAWISSAETITMATGKPVFADVLPETLTINPDSIESRITKRTKGIIVVHLFGQAAHAHALKRVCDKHGLFLIEDCAQAHLTKEFEKTVGGIGNAGTFSFYPTKNLGAYGDAGCIVTNDQDLEKRVRLYANHGGLGEHLMEGTNSRLDSLQAAVLSAKCHHLPVWTEKRIANAQHYNTLLESMDEIRTPVVRKETVHTFHQYVIRVGRRDDLREFLSGQGIQTMIHYPTALTNLPAFRYLAHSKADFPVASQCQEEVLSLPIHAGLSHDQIDYVCESIRRFYGTK
jgi:dTDP-4-amino-4,6-dideoxygalactose transaminase